MKKRWFLAPVAIAILALGVLTAGVALAQEAETEEDSVISSLASRVAAILGLDEATVQDALDQARTEIQDEALQNRLAELVEQGVITQEQADEYLEWYQARPEGIPGFGPGRHGRGFGFGGRGLCFGIPQTPATDDSGTAEGTSL
ncbi:MAG: hypothetical protein L0177_16545 [Chloroflexi bacterium]|nr:hypothetical protein [Chloroflexota bacterium]